MLFNYVCNNNILLQSYNKKICSKCFYAVQEMQPTLDDIQSALNKAVQMILAVNKSVKHWSQTRTDQTLSLSANPPKNFVASGMV